MLTHRTLPLLVALLALSACKAGDSDPVDSDDTDRVDTDDTDADTDDTGPTDADSDGVFTPDDCDDTDASIHPGAPEACDGVDTNCIDSDEKQMVTILGGATYTDLPAALVDAVDGDVISVCDGSFPTSAFIEDDVEIVGVGPLILFTGRGNNIFTIAPGCSVSVSGIRFEGGSTSGSGGAIDATAAAALSVQDCEFSGNSATSGSGGAIRGPANGALEISDSLFVGNRARFGGALAVSGGELARLDIYDGEAAAGGAIHDARDDDPDGLLVLDAVDMHDNTADYGGGLATGGDVDVVGGDIHDNHADLGGGGFYSADQVGTLTDVAIHDNTVSGTNGPGGGIFLDSDADVSLANCAISGNSATYGGGVYVGGGPLGVEGGAITSNLASMGGGVLIDGFSDVVLDAVDLGAAARSNDNDPTDIFSAASNTNFSTDSASASVVCGSTGCQ